MKLFVGVKALIVKEGKVLLIREAVYDEGSRTGEWDVPGGRIQPEETLLGGLAREVREEVGLEVRPGIVLSVQETFRTIKGEPCHIVRIHYLAEYVAGEVVLSSDHDRFEWLSDESQLSDKVCMSGVSELVSNYFAKQDK
jgi:ADP-ribose pyrophosphatase YjhB (NUDIX family)